MSGHFDDAAESTDCHDEAPLPPRTPTASFICRSHGGLQEAAVQEDAACSAKETSEVADGWVVDECDLDHLRKQVVAFSKPPRWVPTSPRSTRAAGRQIGHKEALRCLQGLLSTY
jgi:hypothetical protein